MRSRLLQCMFLQFKSSCAVLHALQFMPCVQVEAVEILDTARIGRLLVERQDAYRASRVLAKYQRRLAKVSTPSSAATASSSASASASASARVSAWLAGQQTIGGSDSGCSGLL